jgi:hypothetical protein
VQFRYGDPNDPIYALYTDWTEDTLGPQGTYLSVPTMEVKLPPMTSGIVEGDEPLEILLPVDAFTTPLASGMPHSPVEVTVWERVDPRTERAAATHTLFVGRVHRTRRNHEGRTDTIVVQAQNLKAQLEKALGLPATYHCIWTFGGRGCGIDLGPLRKTGTLDSAKGKVAQITGLPPQADPRYWHRGYVERLGLRLLIRDWDGDASPGSFRLVREPPSSWVGQTVTLTPGCDKTIEVCRARWNREEVFAGIGYALPPYNPVIESPT